jgi:penicillin-insensitive murein endopeptidase
MRRTEAESRLLISAFSALCLVSGCGAKLVPQSPTPVATRHEPAGAAALLSTLPSNQTHTELPVDDTAESEGEPDLVEDEAPELGPPELGSEAPLSPHPLDDWSEARLESAVEQDLASLGSMSLGRPNAGALLNGLQAEASELYRVVDPRHAFGTRETLDYLARALQQVHRTWPDTPPLDLGHISAERGGPLSPHLSHQSGRDVDISFYYSTGARWYARASEKNLDLSRTWAFVRALVTETDIEMILVDHSIQALLLKYALAHGEDEEWAKSLFQGTSGGRLPIVRHAPGHATHLHLRFYNPIAQETARRAHAALIQRKILPPLVTFVRHRARRGDTLGKLSKRYGVSVEAIKAANGLRSSRIREKRNYRIPVRANGAARTTKKLGVPTRRLPPKRD